MAKKKEKTKSFFETVKEAFKSDKNSTFPWFQSGLVLLGFALGVLVTAGVDIVSRYVPRESDQKVEAKSKSQECREKGGSYDSDNEICKLETDDTGEGCSKNSECEGWCLASEDAEVGEDGKGECSDKITPEGCFKYIDDGMVNEICL